MRIEDVIAYRIARARDESGMSQAQVGRQLERYLNRAWSRQSVSAAEKGRRAFTAAELVALAMVFECSVWALLEPPPDVEQIELGDTGDGPGDHVSISAASLRPAAEPTMAALTEAVARMTEEQRQLAYTLDQLGLLDGPLAERYRAITSLQSEPSSRTGEQA